MGDIEESVYRTLRSEFSETITAADQILLESSRQVDALGALNDLGETLRRGSRKLQQAAIYTMFGRIDIDEHGSVTMLAPRIWMRRAMRSTLDVINQYKVYQFSPSGP
jgi:hypothetical protein